MVSHQDLIPIINGLLGYNEVVLSQRVVSHQFYCTCLTSTKPDSLSTEVSLSGDLRESLCPILTGSCITNRAPGLRIRASSAKTSEECMVVLGCKTPDIATSKLPSA